MLFDFLYLLTIGIVILVLRSYWKLDKEEELWTKSAFLQHPLLKKFNQFFRIGPVQLLLQVIIALIVARYIIYTIQTGYRLTQPNAPFWDFKWFYTASQVIHDRLNPYNLDIFIDYYYRSTGLKMTNAPFVYLPNILPLIWPLGYFSISGASTIWVGIHLISIGLIVWGGNLLLDSRSKGLRAACTIICLLIYGITFDLRIGNISCMITAILIWVIVLAKNKRNLDILAGILLGISTVKPNLAILFFMYFLIKRRYSLVGVGIITSIVFTIIGFLIIRINLAEFLQYFSHTTTIFFNQTPNNPQLSASRIDSILIAYRIFENNQLITKLASTVILGLPTILTGIHLYKRQRLNFWSSNIYLSEIALISCLSLSVNYSQQNTSTMLVFAAIFLLNYLLWVIKYSNFSWIKLSLWLSGIGCLFSQTGLIYFRLLEPFYSDWKKGNLPYIFKITVGSIPNYTILGITIIILILAEIHLRESSYKNSNNNLPEFI